MNDQLTSSGLFKPLNLALIGYGKMGKAIEEIALQQGHRITLKIDSHNTADLTTKSLQHCDVAIEFTGPKSAPANILSCIDAGVPVICGSTGWLNQWGEVTSYCTAHNGALLYASNFSIGVNIFFEINKKLASMMASYPAYDVMIEEIHHTEKKDTPSGTAITIAEGILNELARKRSWRNEPSEDKEILTIISKRIDPAPGTHIVRYQSDVDDIEITHSAHNRTGFSAGAMMAAAFLAGRKGIYSMKEVLGF
ncbi:MAG: 4-hydroxy-tetrahydrodipicolinate reductase [Ferruginibacter sp.]|nr:4-hydroxy-tetrahydrodipicolinate reductase [Ferruginibacter sp.]